LKKITHQEIPFVDGCFYSVNSRLEIYKSAKIPGTLVHVLFYRIGKASNKSDDKEVPIVDPA
jgi:hypothetical protein